MNARSPAPLVPRPAQRVARIGLLLLALGACTSAPPPTASAPDPSCAEVSEDLGFSAVFDMAAAQQVTDKHGPQIDACRALSKEGASAKDLRVAFAVESSGLVSGAEILPPKLATSAVALCVRNRISCWRFPRFAGEPVRFAYWVNATPSLAAHKKD